MCARCRAEYEDLSDRRYHAQPVACPQCGPGLTLFTPLTTLPLLQGDEALRAAQELLRTGKIVAVKGLGGFHLACDASREEAVQRLRRRKGRESKPLAVMVDSLATAERLVELDESSREL